MPITKDEVLLNSLYIDVTWEQLNLAKTTLNLIPGQVYRITDRYNYQSGGSGLIPNQSFLGDDRGIVYIRALTNSELNKEVVRVMACPKTYGTTTLDGNDWNGVWHASLVLGVDELTIRGARVFKNLGLDPTGTYTFDNTLDNINWILIDKSTFSNNEYIDLQFSCLYDFDNDWFEEQRDGKGNIVGISFVNTVVYSITELNPCDITDWNMEEGQFFPKFINNKVKLGIYNNVCSDISDNYVSKYIKGNYPYVQNNNCVSIYNNWLGGGLFKNTGGEIYSNTNSGNIAYNNVSVAISNNSINGNIERNKVGFVIAGNSVSTAITNNNVDFTIQSNTLAGVLNANECTDLSNNSCTGSIYSNKVSSNIGNNSCISISNNYGAGTISSNANTGSITGNELRASYGNGIDSLDATCLNMVNNKLSNTDFGGLYQEWVIDISGLSAITLSFSSYLKDVLITSTNATETITDVLYMTDEQKIKFKPEPTLTSLTFIHNAAKIKCEGGIDAVLNGANGDFIELEKPADFTACRQINIGTY